MNEIQKQQEQIRKELHSIFLKLSETLAIVANSSVKIKCIEQVEKMRDHLTENLMLYKDESIISFDNIRADIHQLKLQVEKLNKDILNASNVNERLCVIEFEIKDLSQRVEKILK